MMSLETRIERTEVAALGDLSRGELAARWVKAYGFPPPKGVKRGLLERAAAWHLQARHFGGLSPTARKTIRDVVKLGSVGTDVSGKLASGRDAGTGCRRFRLTDDTTAIVTPLIALRNRSQERCRRVSR